VPCVQDVLKENPTTVPERYVRGDLEPPVIMDACSGLQVPVIDLGRLASEDCSKLELKKLHHACKDWGFFQVRNNFCIWNMKALRKYQRKMGSLIERD